MNILFFLDCNINCLVGWVGLKETNLLVAGLMTSNIINLQTLHGILSSSKKPQHHMSRVDPLVYTSVL